MSVSINTFDEWIRSRFLQINTELEEHYFAQETLLVDDELTKPIKQSLLEEGNALIADILNNADDIPSTYEGRFYLLGNVGMYMAACRRHEIDTPLESGYSPLSEASTISFQLGSALGVAPRFMATHLGLYNRAINGVYRTFTQLEDETIFIDYNTLGTLAYKKASDALERAMRFGVTHTSTAYLFEEAKIALQEVLKFNEILDEKLDVMRFFYNVRPYYKPYRVGRRDYRGANAGDFAAINEIDLLLGLCSRDDPFYLDIMIDKKAYMPQSEQQRLQDSIGKTSFMDEFLDEMEDCKSLPQYKNNLEVFIQVCEIHGQAYAFHHDQLVLKYIENPAVKLPESQKDNLTASGPPLPVLIRSLAKLRDLRMAEDRSDIPSRYADLEKLKALL
jgi:Monodechloroaminopyrrolnitrin synthase PrnB